MEVFLNLQHTRLDFFLNLRPHNEAVRLYLMPFDLKPKGHRQPDHGICIAVRSAEADPARRGDEPMGVYRHPALCCASWRVAATARRPRPHGCGRVLVSNASIWRAQRPGRAPSPCCTRTHARAAAATSRVSAVHPQPFQPQPLPSAAQAAAAGCYSTEKRATRVFCGGGPAVGADEPPEHYCTCSNEG